MKKLYFNPAILVGKDAKGLDVASYIREVIRDCGLTCTPSCPGGDCFETPAAAPRLAKSKNLSREEANTAFSILLNMVNELKDEVAKLKGELGDTEPLSEELLAQIMEPEAFVPPVTETTETTEDAAPADPVETPE